MATSGSYDYSLTGTTIIQEALELLAIKDPNVTVDSNNQATCLTTLNLMIKAWQAEGIGLWKNVEGTLFPEYAEYVYSIGPSGDHCSALGYKTEIATAAASGAGTITVDSDDNISNADVIGIELDDGTVQWTTVNGAPAANVVTLTAVLTDSAAVDNHVYSYTSIIQRPLEIIEIRRVNTSGYETPIQIISRQEYMRLPDKDQLGTPIQVYYDPQLTNGKLYVYQACSDVKEYLKFTARINIEDFDAVANDPDFPQEWLLPITWNLAVLVAPKFGIKLDSNFLIRAEVLKQAAMNFDMENTSVFFRAKGWK